MNRGNWRDRYATNTYDASGELVTRGDLTSLTPAQRKRVVKKENRAEKFSVLHDTHKPIRPRRGLSLIRFLRREARRDGLEVQRRKQRREGARVG